MTECSQKIQLLLKQSRAYAILAQSLHSEYYLLQAKKCLELANELKKDTDNENILNFRLTQDDNNVTITLELNLVA